MWCCPSIDHFTQIVIVVNDHQDRIQRYCTSTATTQTAGNVSNSTSATAAKPTVAKRFRIPLRAMWIDIFAIRSVARTSNSSHYESRSLLQWHRGCQNGGRNGKSVCCSSSATSSCCCGCCSRSTIGQFTSSQRRKQRANDSSILWFTDSVWK